MVTYCKRCVYPDTKPDLTFNDEGVCSACLAFEARKQIDWKAREQQFSELVCEIKSMDYEYDCIIPVSGGKDSHYQIIKSLEFGLKPLAVTALTDDLSGIGYKNLRNIANLGVDHVIVTTNPKVRSKINKYTLETVGDISWAEHVTIFTIPVREAIIRNIPLIIWGENPQNEYGGPNEQSQKTHVLDTNWLNEFGGLNGLRVQDIVDAGVATKEDMLQYTPSKCSLVPEGIFLGQFFPWDGYENFIVARDHGFNAYHRPIEGSGVIYENLDNYQTGVHDYFKWLKFGFGRATDIACNHIRRGKITREEAIKCVEQWDGQYPYTYLDKALWQILANIGLSIGEFLAICDKFTNLELFHPRMNNDERPIPKFKGPQ